MLPYILFLKCCHNYKWACYFSTSKTPGSLLSDSKFKCLSMIYKALCILLFLLLSYHLICHLKKRTEQEAENQRETSVSGEDIGHVGPPWLPNSRPLKPCSRLPFEHFIHQISMYHKMQGGHINCSGSHTELVAELRFSTMQSSWAILPLAHHLTVIPIHLICVIKHVLLFN